MADNHQVQDFKNITTFHGLNALRGIAAFLVVLHHGEAIKNKYGLENYGWLGLFRNGGNAVTFFFVLSGFLITYLLLKENGHTGNIKVKNFYIKRILRIWPLYFLLVFIGTIALPIIFKYINVSYTMPYSFQQTWFLFVFFLPGLVTYYYGHHFLEPLWSIGVEEAFYILWAPLFKISRERILNLFVSVILIKITLSLIGIHFFQNELFNYIIKTFQFEAMAIGGFGAYLVYTKGSSFSQVAIFKIPSQVILLSIIFIYLMFHTNIDNPYWNFFFKTPVFSQYVINFLFLFLILCVSCINNSIVKVRSGTLSFLGEISYGIYMYHALLIFATILYLKNNLMQMNSFLGLILFYTVVGISTITIATLSKYVFENYFLRLKNKVDKNTDM